MSSLSNSTVGSVLAENTSDAQKQLEQQQQSMVFASAASSSASASSSSTSVNNDLHKLNNLNKTISSIKNIKEAEAEADAEAEVDVEVKPHLQLPPPESIPAPTVNKRKKKVQHHHHHHLHHHHQAMSLDENLAILSSSGEHDDENDELLDESNQEDELAEMADTDEDHNDHNEQADIEHVDDDDDEPVADDDDEDVDELLNTHKINLDVDTRQQQLVDKTHNENNTKSKINGGVYELNDVGDDLADEAYLDAEQLDENNNNTSNSRTKKGNHASRGKTAVAAVGGVDLIVCGNCHMDFKLANMSEFMQHKINKCNSGGTRGVGAGQLLMATSKLKAVEQALSRNLNLKQLNAANKRLLLLAQNNNKNNQRPAHLWDLDQDSDDNNNSDFNGNYLSTHIYHPKNLVQRSNSIIN